MQIVEGIVVQIRKSKAFSVLMEDQNWYGAGFGTELPFKEGNKIRFLVKVNGNFKNIDMDNLEILDTGTEVPEDLKPKQKKPVNKGGFGAGLTGGRAGGTAQSNSRNDYWEKKAADDKLTQREIRYQAALKAALEMTELALEHGAITLGAKKNLKLKVIEEAVDKYARKFYTDVVDVRVNDVVVNTEDNATNNSGDYE